MQYLQCLFLCLLSPWLGAAASIPISSTNLVNPVPLENIHLPDSVLNATDLAVSSNETASTPANATIGHIPRFNDTIYDAAINTLIRYPKAVFLQIQATSEHNPTSDPEDLHDVRLIFGLNGKAIYVEMREWGHWGPPRLTNRSPPPGNAALPLQIAMDLPQADMLIKQAGYREPYEAVDVRWPNNLPPSRGQAYYLFGMVDPRPFTVAVGTRDKIVQANPALDSVGDVGDTWLSRNGASTS